MSNNIILKKSSVSNKVPLDTDLVYGELALNYADGKLYYKKSDNTIDSFLSKNYLLPLTGGTMTGNIQFNSTNTGLNWIMNTDSASIKFYNTGDGDTDSRLEFNTSDNTNEYFRWTHSSPSNTTYESMRLVPNTVGASVLSVNGSIGIGNNSPSAGLEIGSTTSGKSAKVTATLGTEIAPSIVAGNWNLGVGWSISSGQLIKIAGTASSVTPATSFTITPGKTYKVVINVLSSVVNNSYLSYSIGGVAGSVLNAGTITDYITAVNNSVLTFSDISINESITITSISVKELDITTGNIIVDGSLTVQSSTRFTNPISIGIGAPSTLTSPLTIMTTNAGEALRIYRYNSSNQYLALNESDGSTHVISAVGEKPFKITSSATNDANPLSLGIGSYVNALNIVPTTGNVGINTTTPGFKLHVAGNAHVQDYLRITNTAGNQKLLMGNQDSAGVNNPSILGAANGTFYFGNGNSWANDGGTVTYHSNFNSTGLAIGLGTTGANYKLHVSGTGYATTDFRAPIFYDSADTTYYCDPGSTSRLYHLQVDKNSTSDRDKIRVWSSSEYAIGMQSGITYGGLENDWGMTFQFNNADSRGFWWGDTAHSTAQGAMALTTNGKLTVAHSIRVGFGESDTTIPGAVYGLEVNGSIYGNTVETNVVVLGSKIRTSVITGTLSANTTTSIDSWAINTYRSGIYQIQLTQGTKYQFGEFRVIHDGTNTYITEFSILENSTIGSGTQPTFTATISAGMLNLNILIDNASTTNVTYIIEKKLYSV